MRERARAQEHKSTRAQERKSARAQEHKSARAQEHLNMKRTFRLMSLHCCQPMSPGHEVEIQLNFERKTFALKNVAHHKPIALCARSKGKHEAQDNNFAPITWIRTCTCVLLDRLRRDVSGLTGVHNHGLGLY